MNIVHSILSYPRPNRLTRLVVNPVPPATRYSQIQIVVEPVKRDPIAKREPVRFSCSVQVFSNTSMTIWVNGTTLDTASYPFKCTRASPWSPWKIEGNPPCTGRGDGLQLAQARALADQYLTKLSGTSLRVLA